MSFYFPPLGMQVLKCQYLLHSIICYYKISIYYYLFIIDSFGNLALGLVGTYRTFILTTPKTIYLGYFPIFLLNFTF